MKKSFTHRLLLTLSLTSILFNTIYPLIPTYRVYAEDVIPVVSESSSSTVESSSTSSVESSLSSTSSSESSSSSSSTLSESSSSASSSQVSSESSSSASSSSTSSAVSFEEVIPSPKKGVNIFTLQTNTKIDPTVVDVNATGSVSNFSQCSNDTGVGYSSGDTGCRWINSNLQSNNSAYYEGDATVQRLYLTDLSNGEHTVTIKYNTTKNGKHAYDFVTDDKYSETWITDSDMCEDLNGFAGCSGLTPNLSSLIPTDPMAGGFDSIHSNRHFKIRNGTITNVSTPTIDSGSYVTTSETVITITFTVDTSTCVNAASGKCPALLTWGQHVSKQAEWGAGQSAVNITGSPYHVSLVNLDNGSVGSRDNQMQAGAIKGSIILDKVTNPSGSATSFNFTTTGFSTNTTPSLTDQSTPVAWGNLDAGTYTISETQLAGWTLTSKTCTGPGGSVVTQISNGISVNLITGDNLVCTFTNTLQDGQLRVQKTTFPADDPTVFNITASGGVVVGSTSGTVTDSTDYVYTVKPGTFSVSETVPSGWTQTSNTCTNVVVTAGSESTCLITNTKKAHLIVDKVTVPSGDTQSFAFTTTGTGYNGFSLTDAATPNDQELVPATYGVSETALNGWSLTSAVCSDGSPINAVFLSAGETVTCTFTNTKESRIIVDKVTLPSGDPQSFTFTTTGTGYTGFSLTDLASPNNQVLTAGTYSVAETPVNGWAQTSATCSDGSPINAIVLSAGETVTCTFTNTKNGHLIVNKTTSPSGDLTQFSITASGNGTIYGGSVRSVSDSTFQNYEVTPGTYDVVESVPAGWSKTGDTCQNVAVAAGETKTCLLTNVKLGTITIVKDSEPNDPKDFSYTTTGGLTPSTFSLDDDSDPTLSNTQSLLNVFPGSYSVTEGAFTGFNLTAIVCSDPSQNTTFDLATKTASINLGAGENIVCTFTNTKRGHILVNKVTFPSGDPQSFNFTTTGTGYNGFSLTDQADPNDQEVAPGTYSVNESALSGWSLSSATCDDNSPVSAISVSAGETVTCTFVNTKKAHLLVDKVTLPSGDPQVFNFTTTGGGYSNFSLADLSNPNNQELLPGTYGVSETPVNGWVQTSATCSDGSPINAVVLTPGETVTCTFTNTKNGHLIVQKTTFPSGDLTQFSVTASGNGTIYGDSVRSVSDSTDQNYEVTPGTYDVVESVPAGWSKTGDTCQNVVVAAGETKYCLFTNVKLGTITIVKDSEPNDPMDFNYTATGGLTPSTFSLDDDSDPTLSNTQTFSNVAPGSYLVTEGAFTGFNLTAIVCSDPSQNSSGDISTKIASINLGAGESVVCTFTNTKKGHIIVDKVTLPSGETQSFSFTTSGTGYSGFSLTDQANPNDQELVPGTYSVSETPVSGWLQTSATCTDGSPINAVVLSAGETVTCTFTNTKKAHLIVDKVTLPSGDAQVFNFTTSGSGYVGFNLADQTTPNNQELVPGTYGVNETGLSGWDLTNTTCSDGSPVNAVVLSAGETVTCTFTNTKRAHLIVDKVALPNGDPQVFNFATSGIGYNGFSLTDQASPNNQELVPGTYGVSETPVNGWVQTGYSCSDESPVNAVVLSPGEIVTCTFTNTKNGHLIVQKTTFPSGDLTQFSITANEVSGTIYGDKVRSVSDALDQDYEVTPGTYDVVESVPAGWSKTGDTCQNVAVAAGERKTCLLTNVKLGSISIVKDSEPNDPTDFGFTTTGGLTPSTFNLDDDSDPTLSNTQTYSNLLPGSYSFTETETPGFNLTAINCNYVPEGFQGNGLGSSVELRSAGIDLSAGENVICTFTNTKKAHLIVDKVTNPSNDPQEFRFLVDKEGLLGWDFPLKDSDNPSNDEVEPGVYSVTETAVAGWDLTSAICSDGSPANAVDLSAGETVTCTFTNTKRAHLIVDKVTLPSGDAQVFNFITSGSGYSNFSLDDLSNPNNQELVPGTYGVSETGISGWDLTNTTCSDDSPVNAVVLSAGETVTCTFTNTKRAHLIVDKETLPSGDSQSFDFNVTGNGYSGFSLTDQASPNNQELVPGTYTVSETSVSGWIQTSAVCNDGSEISEIVLSPGETVTCLFTNTKKGHIIVDKVTLPSGDPQSFDFTTTGNGYTGFSLTDEASPNDQEVNPGTYGVSETSVSGWVQTSAICDNNQSIDEITVAPGQTITCTFTNTKNAHLIVDKVTLPSNDPQVFNFFIKGIEYLKEFSLSDQSNPEDTELAPGYYAVKETDLFENWKTTNVECSNQSNSSEMELLPGETVTCTFTNTKNSTLIVQKTTNPSNDPTLFEINLVSENNQISPTGVVVDTISDSTDKTYSLFPGSYSVNEIVPEGWVQTGNTCNDLVLEPGETKTCLFTNTKLSSIKIVKNASVNALDDFTFTDPNGKTFILDDDEGVVGADDEYSNFKDFTNLTPGEYTFTEANPSELWGLKDVVCKDSEGNTYTNVSSLVNGVNVKLVAGVNLTCTFNNVKGEVLGEVLAVTGDNSLYLQLLGLSLILGSLGVLIFRKTRKKYSK